MENISKGFNLVDTIELLAMELAKRISELSLDARVEALNTTRRILHENASPFMQEPVDLVEWVKSDTVVQNDYNPNHVAKPEMKLLERSIRADGYTTHCRNVYR
jgi:hypothetical protein